MLTADAMTIRAGLRLVLTNDPKFSTLWHQKVPRNQQSSLSVGAMLKMGGSEIRGAFRRVIATATDDEGRQILNKTLVLYAQGYARKLEMDRARKR